MLAEQNFIDILKSLHALHHNQDNTIPSMWEITGQDQHLYLCAQNQNQSGVDYLKGFQDAVDAINEAGGRVGTTPCSVELVGQEQDIAYTDLPQKIEPEDRRTIPNPKKIESEVKATDRYLWTLAMTRLDGRRHRKFKDHVKNK